MPTDGPTPYTRRGRVAVPTRTLGTNDATAGTFSTTVFHRPMQSLSSPRGERLDGSFGSVLSIAQRSDSQICCTCTWTVAERTPASCGCHARLEHGMQDHGVLHDAGGPRQLYKRVQGQEVISISSLQIQAGLEKVSMRAGVIRWRFAKVHGEVAHDVLGAFDDVTCQRERINQRRSPDVNGLRCK